MSKPRASPYHCATCTCNSNLGGALTPGNAMIHLLSSSIVPIKMPRLNTAFRLILLGVSKSGKTTLLKHILEETNKEDFKPQFTYVFGGTVRDEYWKSHAIIAEQKINTDGLYILYQQIIAMNQRLRRIALKKKTTCALPNWLIILDDVMGLDLSDKKDQKFIDMVSQMRHENISIIISLHALKGTVPKKVRKNMDYLIVTCLSVEDIPDTAGMLLRSSAKTLAQFAPHIITGTPLFVHIDPQKMDGELTLVKVPKYH